MTSTIDGPTDHDHLAALTHQVEQFLYREAALLDDGELRAWFELFADDSLYWVPASRHEIDPAEDVSIIYDNHRRLANRIDWLSSDRAYAQQPRSATVRQVSNVVVDASDQRLEATPERVIEVSCVVVIWESRPNTAHQEIAARARYRLRSMGHSFQIVEKRIILLDPDRHWENLTFLP